MPNRMKPAMTRRVLAAGSYAVLAAIVLGYIDLIPAVDRTVTNAGTLGQIAIDLALVLTAVGGVACWIGGVLHALTK